eukprot:SAG11_NODE_1310_length_5236_cov_2.603270_4_plen_233_part_00
MVCLSFPRPWCRSTAQSNSCSQVGHASARHTLAVCPCRARSLSVTKTLCPEQTLKTSLRVPNSLFPVCRYQRRLRSGSLYMLDDPAAALAAARYAIPPHSARSLPSRMHWSVVQQPTCERACTSKECMAPLLCRELAAGFAPATVDDVLRQYQHLPREQLQDQPQQENRQLVVAPGCDERRNHLKQAPPKKRVFACSWEVRGYGYLATARIYSTPVTSYMRLCGVWFAVLRC